MADALYLHVPFCETICYYCDFKRSLYQEKVVNDWLDALEHELDEKDINKSLKTIYIGGGTPTSLNMDQLERLLTRLEPYTEELEEFTIESNLESIDAEKLALLKRYKVNRISLGVQSFDDDLLVYMNRSHTVKDIKPTIELVANYINNISIDLMYGLFSQTYEVWEKTLTKVVEIEAVTHVSVYSLTIEENSVFYKQGVKQIENESEAKMYQMAIDYLTSHGFVQYEVANFAKPEFSSKHNQYYWRYDDFYGIGVGASGKENHKRYTNNFSIQAYIEGSGKPEIEELTNKDEMFEFIMMNVRLREGLSLKRFESLFHYSFEDLFTTLITKLIKKQAAVCGPTHFIITETGMMYLHDILVSFWEVLDEREDIA
ncbi:oxygen-independent coproporphyrinogen-3 oxidase [Breznakia sp. PF5-3]|uniref:radical SAM family heme chaperone HemW n=1 Tax=unclassified Breznakia TaxID=2623764 RepID=UPI0024074137|nr:MULTISPECIES: radical SAM family heme chaperone HemW [unclassified Breznakia]MDF9823871.1 oxygen-independent coproporphyrinogen-3 oxidase [Breznakia sp. PM6-1]MDF9834670.1 oxygen-independent coproporphyrinogen-3 oxidase [Breznakia sp. PF5-3]MDF9836895.1 oxygen-independent coproporphyrinogen-3 oxidase [Breznakia sp. PFB2-8]MDF9858912.1 oxygen-independent coproporphyrinogen-3 oxidase [Breznakia sp. PH5-24]